MRALLLFNPHATTTDARVRDVIGSALASEVALEVVATEQRGHASHLVTGAVREGIDVVFSLGGDGTANEVIQALAGTDVALGIIPGGGANVLARALGLPNDAISATLLLLESLRAGKTRRIALGAVQGGDAGTATARYFGFNAGFGYDASVVRLVERHAGVKRALRQLAFVWAASNEWLLGDGRRNPPVRVTLSDGTSHGPFAIAILANTDPYTYLGPRALRATPAASFDRGLDVLGIERVPTRRLLRILAAIVAGSGRHLDLPGVWHRGDLDALTLTAARPEPVMVDGDYAGNHTVVHVRSVPEALTVLT